MDHDEWLIRFSAELRRRNSHLSLASIASQSTAAHELGAHLAPEVVASIWAKAPISEFTGSSTFPSGRGLRPPRAVTEQGWVVRFAVRLQTLQGEKDGAEATRVAMAMRKNGHEVSPEEAVNMFLRSNGGVRRDDSGRA